MIATSHELRVVAIGLIAVLLLAGCTALQPAKEPQKSAAKPSQDDVKAAPQDKPDVAKRVIRLDELTGLGEREVENLLGRPNAVSKHPPATVWHYIHGPCALQLSFYIDLATRRRQVLAYETAAVNPPSVGEQPDVCATTITAQKGDATR